MNKENTLNYMTQYRGFAILMIVMVHCITRFLDRSNTMYNYIYAFWSNSTDLFLFISGFLFEHLLYKKYPYKVFIKKKVSRLIVPYIFWALPVSLLLFCYKGFDFKYLGYTMWSGLEHFNDAHWYIPFIFGLFVISPLFVFLQKKKLLYSVFLPLFLFIALTTERSDINVFYGQTMIVNLVGFFFLGMFFSHYKEFFLEKLYRFDWLFIITGCILVVCKGG